MSASPNVKAPKKEQSKQIFFWYFITGIVIIIALVFSVIAVLIAVSFTNSQLKDYAKKYDLYATKDDLDTTTAALEDLSNQVENKISYDDTILIKSNKDGAGGYLTDINDGYGRFQDKLNPDPAEDETNLLHIERQP
jgi:hypothetical protein